MFRMSERPGPTIAEARRAAAGLELDRAAPPEPAVDPHETPEPVEVDRLRDQLREAERRAELAEALASERERALEDLRIALRALGSGEPPPTMRALGSGEPPPTPAPAAPQAPRRRWPWTGP